LNLNFSSDFTPFFCDLTELFNLIYGKKKKQSSSPHQQTKMRFLPLVLLGTLAMMYVTRPVYGLSVQQHNLEEESRIISELQSEVDNEEASNSNQLSSPAMDMADAALLEIGAISATEVQKGGKGGKSGSSKSASKSSAKASKAGKKAGKKAGGKKAGKKGKKAGKKNGRTASKKARKSGRKARKARKARKPKRIASKKVRTLDQHKARARKAKLKAFKAMKKMKKWGKTKGKKLSAAAKKARLAAKRKMLKALGKLKLQYERRRLRKMQAKADSLVAQQKKDAAKLAKAQAIPQWKPFVPKGYKAPKRRAPKRRKQQKKKVSLSKLKKQIKKQLKKKLGLLAKKKTARREARKQKQWAKKQASKLKKAAKKAAKRKALRTAQKVKAVADKLKARNALQKAAEEVGKVFVPKAAVAAKKKKPARKMRTILPAAKPKLAKAAPRPAIKKCKKKSVIQLLKAKLAENKKKAMHLHHQLVKFQKYGKRPMKWNIDEDGTGSGLHVPPNVPKKDKQALKDYEKMMKNVETLHLLGANRWSIAEADIKKGHVLTGLADAQRERLRDFDQEQQAEMLTPEGWANGEIEPDVYNEFEPIH